jgi:hypothetical protein
VRETDFVSPVASSDGDNIEFSMGNCTFDCSLNILGSLPANTDMAFSITDNNIGLESSPLPCSCLLLDWLDGEWFFLQFVLQEEINDLSLYY